MTGKGTACDIHRFNYRNEYMRVYMARRRDRERVRASERKASVTLTE